MWGCSQSSTSLVLPGGGGGPRRGGGGGDGGPSRPDGGKGSSSSSASSISRSSSSISRVVSFLIGRRASPPAHRPGLALSCSARAQLAPRAQPRPHPSQCGRRLSARGLLQAERSPRGPLHPAPSSPHRARHRFHPPAHERHRRRARWDPVRPPTRLGLGARACEAQVSSTTRLQARSARPPKHRGEGRAEARTPAEPRAPGLSALRAAAPRSPTHRSPPRPRTLELPPRQTSRSS